MFFFLLCAPINCIYIISYRDSKALPIPRVIGSRQSISVMLPIPESVFSILPTKEATTFKVTPVFFNIGINEKATLSETLGYTREQHRFVFYH